MDRSLYPILGKRLFDAYESNQPVGAFSLEYPDIKIEDAYAIQMELKKCHFAVLMRLQRSQNQVIQCL